jgi:molecular chaperone GrpE (heat shock protein)
MLENVTPFHNAPIPHPPAAERTAPLEQWKALARAQFEDWLSSVGEIPELETTEEPDADAFSLFAELTALRAESRKGNRKAAEVFTQFGDTLTRFQSEFARLKEQLAPSKEGALPRAHCLALAELLDRVRRLRLALESPPKPGAFGALGRLFTAPWATAWSANRQALEILAGHLERLLLTAGLVPVATLGKIFDPNTMVAVSSEPASAPPFTVLEEFLAGYLREHSVLRPAEVKISKPTL